VKVKAARLYAEPLSKDVPVRDASEDLCVF
jgi:hypothetical protein